MSAIFGSPARGVTILAAVAAVASGMSVRATTKQKNCTRTYPNQPIDTGFPQTYLPKLYAKCADEGGACACDGAVIYGVPSINYWSEIVVSEGSVDCNAASFPVNLDVGKPRECWCKPRDKCAKEDLAPYDSVDVSSELNNIQSFGPGLELLSVEKCELFGMTQRFFAVFVDPSKGHKVDVSYVHDGQTLTTPGLAELRDAVAAVNGGYHSYGHKPDVSITKLKVDGDVIVAQDDPTKYGLVEENVEGVMAVDEAGNIKISSALDESAWKGLPTYLHSGPLIMVDGVAQPLDSADPQFINHSKQPRSVVCSMNDGRSALVVLDGRYYDSAGLTLPQLTKLLQAMGMKSCLNMDGGGSATMYLKDRGVVNQPRQKPPPCEDGFIDYITVRNVTNAIVVL